MLTCHPALRAGVDDVSSGSAVRPDPKTLHLCHGWERFELEAGHQVWRNAFVTLRGCHVHRNPSRNRAVCSSTGTIHSNILKMEHIPITSRTQYFLCTIDTWNVFSSNYVRYSDFHHPKMIKATERTFIRFPSAFAHSSKRMRKSLFGGLRLCSPQPSRLQSPPRVLYTHWMRGIFTQCSLLF